MKVQEIATGAEYQPKKKYKRKKFRALRFIRLILVILFIMAVLVSLALSPLFYINRIEVYGNKHYNSSEVINASGLIMGTNWFKSNSLDLKGIVMFRSIDSEKMLLERCPYLKSAVVRIGIPGVVRITVTEREPVALVPYLGTNLVIDNHGHVIDTTNNVNGSELPTIRGVVCNGYMLGQALKVDNYEYIEAFNVVMKTIASSDANAGERGKEFCIKDIVTYIDVTDLDNVAICLDSRIVVNFGGYKEINEYRIDFLREIYYLKLKEEDRGLLDFTSGEYPSFIPD
ncbi:MAG: FtsQ-type POTRA domain-containing protein [Clostridium sp.]|nr:FtsQ-type POTRA domain-containing protein [Clostridium sp.]